MERGSSKVTSQRTSFLREGGWGGKFTSKGAGQSPRVTGHRWWGDLLGNPEEPGLEKGKQNWWPHGGTPTHHPISPCKLFLAGEDKAAKQTDMP